MEMAPNDSTDQSSFSNTSQFQEESADKDERVDEKVDKAPEGEGEEDNKFQPPKLEIPLNDHNDVIPSAPVLIPSMKGTMTYSGGSVICKGKWAMSDASHDIAGQTSDFEFRLIKKSELCSNIFPVDGTYQGWFLLRQAPPAKGSVKVDDKEMEINFQSSDDGSFQITGHGSNKFGLFNLRGTLSELGSVHIYREYFQLAPQSLPTPTGKKSSIGRPEGLQRRPSVSVDASDVSTPREGTGRIRKQSSVMREYQELSQKPVATPRSNSSSANAFDGPVIGASASNVSSGTIVRQSSVSGERTHRLPAIMRKCGDVLREMTKLPQARWFLEPVDPIKLGIPEYPKIIKDPMDFTTIKTKIENNEYETLDAFAEDMRLVFRNAITFNSAKDNIVNINAREVSAKFEDRYRSIVVQMEGNAFSALGPVEPKLARSTSSASFSSSAAKSVPSASSLKKRTSTGQNGRPSLSSGPRQALPYVPPAAVDSNVSHIIELQRQMAAMKEEIDRLRAQLNEKEIAKALQETKEAAQTPLSYEEKRQLVTMAAKLPAEKMDELVQIIRDGLPDDKKNDEISEVPLEILDTLTLRRLQKFVKDNLPATKKRPSSTIPRNKSEPTLKKSKKSFGGNDLGTGVASTSEPADIDLFDHNELLLENEKFDSTGIDNRQKLDVVNDIDSGVRGFEQSSMSVTESSMEVISTQYSIPDTDEGNEWEALG